MSRESTDLANVRSAYAEVMAAAITGDKNAVYSATGETMYNSDTLGWKAVVNLKQKQDDWQGSVTDIGGIEKSDGAHWRGIPKSGGTGTVFVITQGEIIISWNGYTYYPSQTWTYSGKVAVGSTLRLDTKTDLSDWGSTVTSVFESIEIKPGQTITVAQPDDTSLAGFCYGFYVVDENMVIKADSGEIKTGGTYTIPSNLTGDNLSIRIQLLGYYNGKVAPTTAQAGQLMDLITIQ